MSFEDIFRILSGILELERFRRAILVLKS